MVTASSIPSCPKCGCSKYQNGPSAGLSRNVRCENGHCWNWIAAVGRLDDIGNNTDDVPGCSCSVAQPTPPPEPREGASH